MTTDTKLPSLPVREERSGFLPVGVDTITASTELPFDLYLRVAPTSPPVLYREHRLALESSDFQRLSEQGTVTLYIRVADHIAYRNYLIETILHNRDVPGPRRFHVLKIANRAVFQSALGNRNPDKLVNFAAEYGDELADIVCDEDLATSEMLGLMEHDYYTYTHATNVCVLSLLVARELGFGVHDGIVALASGAVIHDIGKRQIAPALLNQEKPLSTEQWEMIQQHPKLGFMELCHRQDLVWGQLMMVYQHHERWNGRGYPVGFVGEEIHPWAKVCAVADVYDAMASARPYRGRLACQQGLGSSGRGIQPGVRRRDGEGTAIGGERMTFTETIARVACEIVVPPDAHEESRGSVRLVDLDKDKRRFPRFPCRMDAILQYQGGLPALRRSRDWMRIKVQNVSRCGMGFLHSEAMFPLERASIVFPRGIQRIIVAQRCRRMGPHCFEIGGEFSELLDNPGEEGLR